MSEKIAKTGLCYQHLQLWKNGKDGIHALFTEKRIPIANFQQIIVLLSTSEVNESNIRILN